MNIIENILQKLGSIEKDKLLHFIFGAGIMAESAVLFMLFLNPYISVLFGFLFSNVVSVLKEYIWDDKLGHGVFSKKDIYYGLFGSVLESLILLFTVLIIKL